MSGSWAWYWMKFSLKKKKKFRELTSNQHYLPCTRTYSEGRGLRKLNSSASTKMKALQISALLTKGLSFTSRFKLIQNRIVRSHNNKHELHKVLCRARSSSVELTSVRHPEIIRGNYSRLTEDDLSVFRNILTTNRCVSDPADLEPYNVDWMKSYRGKLRCFLIVLFFLNFLYIIIYSFIKSNPIK